MLHIDRQFAGNLMAFLKQADHARMHRDSILKKTLQCHLNFACELPEVLALALAMLVPVELLS